MDNTKYHILKNQIQFADLLSLKYFFEYNCYNLIKVDKDIPCCDIVGGDFLHTSTDNHPA